MGNWFLNDAGADVQLVGGAGTVYDPNHIDNSYGRVDGLNGNPGYFTAQEYTEGEITELGTWLDAPIEPTKFSFSIEKDYRDASDSNIPLAIAENEFSFDLVEITDYQAGIAYDPEAGTMVASVSTRAAANGKSLFEFPEVEYGLDDIGNHYYWIVEKESASGRVSRESDIPVVCVHVELSTIPTSEPGVVQRQLTATKIPVS